MIIITTIAQVEPAVLPAGGRLQDVPHGADRGRRAGGEPAPRLHDLPQRRSPPPPRPCYGLTWSARPCYGLITGCSVVDDRPAPGHETTSTTVAAAAMTVRSCHGLMTGWSVVDDVAIGRRPGFVTCLNHCRRRCCFILYNTILYYTILYYYYYCCCCCCCCCYYYY